MIVALAASSQSAEFLDSWGPPLLWIGGAIVVGLVAQWAMLAMLRAGLRRSADADVAPGGVRPGEVLSATVRQIRRPASLVVPLLLVLWALGPARLEPDTDRVVRHAVAILLIASSTWLVTRVVSGAAGLVIARYDTSVRDNLRARKVHTEFRVITRITNVLIWGIGIAAILVTFPSIRQLGTSVLASAGIAGLVVGLAAQRTIGNFLAGIQIALTQPIRLDDAVVIDGEWGWIEEITVTYVVVKIWDERRLVVPFSTLLERPFQNWTRTTAHLLGQVTLWMDYRVPVQAVRDELHRIVAETELWDGRVAVLQVVDANDRAVQLRALVSAGDSPTAWDLRCFVREKLIGFVQREHPEGLPTVRAAIERPAQAAPPRIGDSVPEAGGLPGAPDPGPVDPMASAVQSP